jgi:pimeloyl-ACP methyl ester carboxylesterase
MSTGNRFWVGGLAAAGIGFGVMSGISALPGCGSSSGGGETSAEGGGGGGGDDASTGQPPAVFLANEMSTSACPVVVKRGDCDPTTRPLVFVHGTYSSGTDIEHMAALLGSNGYCQDRIVAIDYDSVSASPSFTGGGVDSPGADCTATNMPAGCEIIDRAVNRLLAKFPQFKQVDLAGHSQGTFHCGTYLAAHPDKIAHYINFSGVPNVGNIPTLSLSSQRDLFGSPHHATGDSICAFQQLDDGGTMVATTPSPSSGGPHQSFSDIPGADAGGGDAGAACNVWQYTFIHQDHFAVAASKDSFVQVYRYLTGKDPQYTDIQCGDDPVAVEGIAERFADNAPINGGVKIREVTSTPQDTTAPTMDIMGMSGSADGGTPPGHFGPIMLKRNVQYVFEGYDDKGKLVGWQYFTPFKRDNRLVRLLSPSSSTDGTLVGGIVAMQSTDHAVASTGTTVVVARWAQGGIRQDLGASLKVNGIEVLSSDNSGLNAAKSMNLQGGVAALFLEDTNKNGKTDLGLPYSTTFIAFTDAFISATKPGFLDLTFTAGSEDPVTVNMPIVVENYPSKASADAATADNHFVAVMFQ